MAAPDSAPPRPAKPRGVADVTNFIAVASGKGGVGKSTVAANLAVALAQSGAKVGLLDADVYGPSVPLMFGVPEGEKPRLNDDRHIVPLLRYGVKLLSMGFLVDGENAVIWRGPMVSSAIRQFLGQAAWGELDYLVLDLPPGTGDIQLTLVQTVPLTGAVVVSTPQAVALADARKAVAMFGIVHVPVLGEIPIEQAAREAGDLGTPVVLAEPESASAKAFVAMAERVAAEVERRNAEAPPTLPIEILYK